VMILAVLSLSLEDAREIRNEIIMPHKHTRQCRYRHSYFSTMTALYSCQMLFSTNCTNIDVYLPSLLCL